MEPIFFLAVVAILVLAVVAFYLVVCILARAMFGNRRRLEEELGLDALRHRFERGEITQQQFDEARRALGQ